MPDVRNCLGVYGDERGGSKPASAVVESPGALLHLGHLGRGCWSFGGHLGPARRESGRPRVGLERPGRCCGFDWSRVAVSGREGGSGSGPSGGSSGFHRGRSGFEPRGRHAGCGSGQRVGVRVGAPEFSPGHDHGGNLSDGARSPGVAQAQDWRCSEKPRIEGRRDLEWYWSRTRDRGIARVACERLLRLVVGRSLRRSRGSRHRRNGGYPGRPKATEADCVVTKRTNLLFPAPNDRQALPRPRSSSWQSRSMAVGPVGESVLRIRPHSVCGSVGCRRTSRPPRHPDRSAHCGTLLCRTWRPMVPDGDRWRLGGRSRRSCQYPRRYMANSLPASVRRRRPPCGAREHIRCRRH